MVVTAVLAYIGCKAGWPSLVVQSAVLTYSLSAIVQHVGVEELACVRCSTGWRVLQVVGARLRARGCAEAGVERSVGENLDAHVCIGAVTIERRIDGGVAEGNWT